MELINREQAIKFATQVPVSESVRTMITNLLKLVPTIERPTGKWIDNSEDGYVECPFCHEATNCDGNIGELRYCWNCGAEMEK